MRERCTVAGALLRILLCDDAIGFPALFSAWMHERGHEVVAETPDPDDAVRLAVEQQPDVVVLDHRLGAVTSESVVPTLRREIPSVRIVLMSAMPDDQLGVIAERVGADGFVSRLWAADRFCAGVEAVGLRATGA